MKELCHTKQETCVRGLGLILKVVKHDYQRIGVLSRRICLFNGNVIVVRELEKTILTNTTCSLRLTPDEGNYLAALSLSSFSNDPLSNKLA